MKGDTSILWKLSRCESENCHLLMLITCNCYWKVCSVALYFIIIVYSTTLSSDASCFPIYVKSWWNPWEHTITYTTCSKQNRRVTSSHFLQLVKIYVYSWNGQCHVCKVLEAITQVRFSGNTCKVYSIENLCQPFNTCFKDSL